MHLNSALLFKKYALEYFKDNYNVLEIGPDMIPSSYRGFVNNASISWKTLDLGEHLGNVDYVSKDIYSYPFEDNTFDIIFSGQVMEHVPNIFRWMKELTRIVKKGGYIITINPISWPYHRAPVDCWRVYPDGMKALCEESGITCVLSVFETLEPQHFKWWNPDDAIPLIPGRTLIDPEGSLKEKHVRSRILFTKIILRMPYFWRFVIPLEVSYDTITIAKK